MTEGGQPAVRRLTDKILAGAIAVISALIALVYSQMCTRMERVECSSETQQERIIRTEQGQYDMNKRLDRMEGKIDKLLERDAK